MEVIIDVQGLRQSHNEFVVKELAAINLTTHEEPTCVLFEPPCDWHDVPKKYRVTNLWLTEYYHGLTWEAGDIPYEQLKNKIKLILKDKTLVYVKGLEGKKWLEDIIGESVPVVDMQDLDCPSLKDLGKNHHHYKHHVNDYQCAIENVKLMKQWIIKNMNYLRTLNDSQEIDV